MTRMRADLLRNVGNEMFLVVPPAPLEPGKEYELEFRHAGKVIFDAGNRVYYVGARANWFPNIGLQFAKYDLTFRYPKDLDLVTAGRTGRGARRRRFARYAAQDQRADPHGGFQPGAIRAGAAEAQRLHAGSLRQPRDRTGAGGPASRRKR